MRLQQAYSKAKELNCNDDRTACRLVYRNYSGYGVECEPFELPIVRASLETIASNHRGFLQNYKAKYARK